MTRYNRQFVANVAIDVLVPAIKKSGTLRLGNGIEPSCLTLATHGLTVILIENHLEKLEGSLRSVLNIWEPGCGKVFAASWGPLEIISFRSGTWIDTVIEMSLES